MRKKILLGLSGGVDSAVAAYLLKKEGYDVTCAFMRNWDSFANNDILGNPTIEEDICPQEQDYLDAKEVADQLELPLLRIDFVKEYWDYVFLKFLEEYKKGRTPNPDILCNKYIKFDAFLHFALENGFDSIATGHYVQVQHGKDENVMLKGKDKNKDQTYFLSQITQEALSRSYFPIGKLEKKEVRELAEQLNLTSVSKKKDSTGICFIGERNFRKFLQNYLPSKCGKIININTLNAVGEHIGVLYYTIGQRKGLNIGGDLGPWFVVGKDIKQNILYVCNESEKEWLHSDSCLVSNVNWISAQKPNYLYSCKAKFRYRQQDHGVKIQFLDSTTIFVQFKYPLYAVTCGQEAVFYDEEICLGGGVIEEVFKDGIPIQERIQRRLQNDSI